MAEPRKFHCVGCRKRVTATSDDHYRKHDREKGIECPRSKRDIPAWLLKRGPESGPEDEIPVKGRDYADCPRCDASPVLDGATGHFTDHMSEGATPTSPRVPCPMSGEPYVPEGEECETNTADQGVVSPSTAVPGTAPGGGARPPSQPESSTNQSEEMISKWAAAAAKAIENRELPPPRPDAPEAPPTESDATLSAPTAPASSATDAPQAASPVPGSVPQRPCHIAKDHGPHKWMHERRQAQCLGKPAPEGTASTEPAAATRPAADVAPASEAASSREKHKREMTERSMQALARLSRKAAPTPGATPADSAAPAAAGVPERSPASAPPPDAALTPTASGRTEPAAAAQVEPLFAQPGSPFSQPAKPPAAVPAVPMTVMAEQVAARMKELFYGYDNRRSADNRSAQATLGPSEIGTPCDRRLAMSLLRIPPSNPGGDGWAAFVGTCIHAGLAEMFQWADANTGRFAVEQRLTFPNDHVPKGTADLLDRTLCMVDDHKAMGRWSLDKLKSQGMTPTQRVQLHTYGFGQRLKGEVVDFVALISWPREASTLADLYVVVEAYDPQIARDALARVDRIAAEIETRRDALNRQHVQPLEVARLFPVADDCKFCPFYAPGDAEGTRGCNGRQ